jgi:hypothetical protein
MLPRSSCARPGVGSAPDKRMRRTLDHAARTPGKHLAPQRAENERGMPPAGRRSGLAAYTVAVTVQAEGVGRPDPEPRRSRSPRSRRAGIRPGRRGRSCAPERPRACQRAAVVPAGKAWRSTPARGDARVDAGWAGGRRLGACRHDDGAVPRLAGDPHDRPRPRGQALPARDPQRAGHRRPDRGAPPGACVAVARAGRQVREPGITGSGLRATPTSWRCCCRRSTTGRRATATPNRPSRPRWRRCAPHRAADSARRR